MGAIFVFIGLAVALLIERNARMERIRAAEWHRHRMSELLEGKPDPGPYSG